MPRLTEIPGLVWDQWLQHWVPNPFKQTDTSMKIQKTQSGVTISTVKPEFVEALVDMIKDLASGDAVLLYGPGFESPVVMPRENLRDEMDRLLHADAAYPGSYTEGYVDSEWWRSGTLTAESHREIWAEVEAVRRPEPVAPDLPSITVNEGPIEPFEPVKPDSPLIRPDIPGEPH